MDRHSAQNGLQGRTGASQTPFRGDSFRRGWIQGLPWVIRTVSALRCLSLPLPASLESMYACDWLLPREGVGSVLPARGPRLTDCPGLCTGGK